ncbi:MAG: hypothetical protein AAF926_04190 [Pseudomonadota bacterium]
MPNKYVEKIQSTLPLAFIVGGFVWIVFESFVFGLLAFMAVIILRKRDAREDEEDAL